MNNRIRRFTYIIALLLCFAGCALKAEAPLPGPVETPPATYALLAKDIHNPYMNKMYEGFSQACREIGVNSVFAGPDTPTAEGQVESIAALVEQDVSVIAVAANDENQLQQALQAAMAQGIAVLSVDSAVNKDSRRLHIQQADPEMVGRVLIQAAHRMMDGEGEFAILSATASATNQNLWIEWMLQELSDKPDKYAGMKLDAVVYGDDLPEVSADAARRLMQDYPNLKLVISPSVVGMLSAAKVLSTSYPGVRLTGLGLPSEMEPYIKSGLCPWMYLWNPVDMGYLAAYTGKMLLGGSITGAAEETFYAGRMGLKSIIAAADGGTEVMLGDPFKFDKDNIAEWKSIY